MPTHGYLTELLMLFRDKLRLKSKDNIHRTDHYVSIHTRTNFLSIESFDSTRFPNQNLQFHLFSIDDLLRQSLKVRTIANQWQNSDIL